MNRRLLTILAVALALVAVVFAIYFLFFRGTQELPPDTTGGNPFGNTGAGTAGYSIEIPEVGVPMRGAGEEIAPQLYKITNGPVAEGVAAFPVKIQQQAVGTSTPAPAKEDVEVRYVERASGNIYRFQLGERLLERLTNLTLPGVLKAAWSTDGSRAFLRFLSEETGGERLETYSLPADGSEGYFLEPRLSDVVVTATSSVLSVLPSTNGSVGTRSTLLGASPSTVFTTPLAALHVFAAGTSYAAATKASALVPGYAFTINRTSGELTRVLGPLTGLAILPSPNGSKILYTFRANGAMQVAVYDTATGDSTTLPVATLAEKCVWTSDSTKVYCAVPRSISGTLPDDWYLGTRSTSDRVWKIDLATRVATLEFDPSFLAEIDIDAVALTLDSKDDVLVFTNRDDGSLWLYDL